MLAALPPLLVPLTGMRMRRGLDGAAMRWPYALPFAGLLLSIALGPLFVPKLWHHHYGKVAAAWAALALRLVGWFAGGTAMLAAFVHAMLAEYSSASSCCCSRSTSSPAARPDQRGHQGLAVDQHGHPGIGDVDGQRRRHHRRCDDPDPAADPRQLWRGTHYAHVVIFFIILVANVGGALSPLGDPPLFVGFLHGVDFFWTTVNI